MDKHYYSFDKNVHECCIKLKILKAYYQFLKFMK